MFASLRANLVWQEGKALLYGLLCVAFLGLFFWPLLLGAMVFFLGAFYFFRNPERVCPEAQQNKTVLICPADGKIVSVEPVDDDRFSYKVAIFLSPFDVHVNWAPVSGKIEQVKYHQGAFAMAFLPKSSELNERNDVLLKMESDTFILVRQIAGTLARTIVCWVREGENITSGQKYGMIKFGSRVEVFVPGNVSLTVKKGERVFGGRTVLGRLQ